MEKKLLSRKWLRSLWNSWGKRLGPKPWNIRQTKNKVTLKTKRKGTAVSLVFVIFLDPYKMSPKFSVYNGKQDSTDKWQQRLWFRNGRVWGQESMRWTQNKMLKYFPWQATAKWKRERMQKKSKRAWSTWMATPRGQSREMWLENLRSNIKRNFIFLTLRTQCLWSHL